MWFDHKFGMVLNWHCVSRFSGEAAPNRTITAPGKREGSFGFELGIGKKIFVNKILSLDGFM